MTQIWDFLRTNWEPVLTLVVSALAVFIAVLQWRRATKQWSTAEKQSETAKQQWRTAEKQAETAKNKLRLDLFDRRIGVFDALMTMAKIAYTTGDVSVELHLVKEAVPFHVQQYLIDLNQGAKSEDTVQWEVDHLELRQWWDQQMEEIPKKICEILEDRGMRNHTRAGL